MRLGMLKVKDGCGHSLSIFPIINVCETSQRVVDVSFCSMSLLQWIVKTQFANVEFPDVKALL